MTKRVYLFEEGNRGMRDLLGGKGANLAEMTGIGLPVPPGLTITTDTCNEYTAQGKLPDGLMDEVKTALGAVEQKLGKKLGDAANPLLLSVRSGAKFSMPGMMDTVLNLGLNDETLAGLIALTGNPRFAYDAYRRFIMMFSDIVLVDDAPALTKEGFEHVFDQLKKEKGVTLDTDVDADGMKELVQRFKAFVKQESGRDFPNDPIEQLRLAITAVFKSWMNPRAILYRRKEKISDALGTAVNVQSMVFGNMGDDSGTGVAFTRDPSTGENKLYGEFLMNAQGEDVVAGVRTPMPIAELDRVNPALYKQFHDIGEKLEHHYHDMQDIEFTIEKGRLFILQCRNGKRTAAAAVKTAVDMVNEGFVTEEEALNRIDPKSLDQLLHRQISPAAEKAIVADKTVIATGLAASPGAGIGKVYFDSDIAAERAHAGEKVILVRPQTNPDDLHGMLASQAILTAEGGMTSHAAVVARGFGIPCIAGASQVRVDVKGKTFTANGVSVNEGDTITVDGTLGRVIRGAVDTVDPMISGDFETLLTWADKYKRLGVRANADNPEDAAKAFEFGAAGIGLCRTEHMFLGEDRTMLVRQMILSARESVKKDRELAALETEGASATIGDARKAEIASRKAVLENDEDRKKYHGALKQLGEMQKGDFVGIFKAMQGKPVTIRLIDPPLHEFQPHTEESIKETAQKLGIDETVIRHANQDLHEENPMLGLRGCRLSIVFPGIVEMQVRAIFEAAVEVGKGGLKVRPEIMIPLIATANELTYVREELEATAEATLAGAHADVEYLFGTMIELPRAALTAAEIAEHAQFFSFGTNDLTQTTFGFSRDDVEKYVVPEYLQQKILAENPFVALDQRGVGRLMQIAVADARQVKPDIKLGICGEHGGEPSSVKFCHGLGLDYVSCSPFRVPIARLAAAQANIESGTERDK
jgi:pyruvate,orthophosphate dikinase